MVLVTATVVQFSAFPLPSVPVCAVLRWSCCIPTVPWTETGFCGVVTPNKAAFPLSDSELQGENTCLGGCFDIFFLRIRFNFPNSLYF